MSEFTSCDDCARQSKTYNSTCIACEHFAGGERTNWFLPKKKPKQKVIKLDEMVCSDIDMEFSNFASSIDDDDSERLWYTSQLINIHHNGNYMYPNGCAERCRIRQDHWHSFKGDKCPLPEGLIIGYSSTAGARRWVNHCTNYEQLDWSLIYEFKVYGTADDACYEWEKEE